ncbi:SCY1-like protein 2, partial [Aphis craccivora]
MYYEYEWLQTTVVIKRIEMYIRFNKDVLAPTGVRVFNRFISVGVSVHFLSSTYISDKIGWSDFRRGSSLPSAPSTAGTMFSKLKSGTSSVSQGAQVLSTNNILNLFEVGKFVCSAGPELIWKVYEGFRKPDGK